ncbi:MAG: hypothetical protein PVI66_08055 [Candidatus Aminicenantes bacterium]|jgi:hypothetical protein
MELNNLLKKIEKVEAPPHFEQKVMAELSLRKRSLARKMRWRLSFAGAFSAAAILLVVIGLFVLPERRPGEMVSAEKSAPSAIERQDRRRVTDYIPIVEAVDYTGEMRTVRDQPPTIYILEHVSESTDTKIIY